MMNICNGMGPHGRGGRGLHGQGLGQGHGRGRGMGCGQGGGRRRGLGCARSEAVSAGAVPAAYVEHIKARIADLQARLARLCGTDAA